MFKKINFLIAFLYFWLNAGHCLSQSETTLTFYVVRHGQTDWNLQKRMQGHTDIPLNSIGRKQAEDLAQKLKNINFTDCFTSDLQRAYETAAILTAFKPIQIIQDSRLKERNFGIWEGSSSADYKKAKPDDRLDIESIESMVGRIFQVFDQIISSQHQGQMLVVTHGGVIRVILSHLFDFPFDKIEIQNTAFIKISYHNGKWILEDSEGIKI